MTITPQSNQTGTATLILTVNDTSAVAPANQTASTTFVLTVGGVNALAPTITGLVDSSTPEDHPTNTPWPYASSRGANATDGATVHRMPSGEVARGVVVKKRPWWPWLVLAVVVVAIVVAVVIAL